MKRTIKGYKTIKAVKHLAFKLLLKKKAAFAEKLKKTLFFADTTIVYDPI